MSARPRRTALLVLAALPVLAACGGAADDVADGALVPAQAPSGWVEHTLGDVRVSTPQTWAETDRREGDGPANLTVRGGSDPAAPDSPVVNITVVPEPERGLDAEVDGVRSTVQVQFGADEFVEEPLDWPGAAESAYLEYVGDQPAGDGTTVPVRSAWLFSTLDDGRQVLVVVSSPEERFEEDELSAVLTTVELPG